MQHDTETKELSVVSKPSHTAYLDLILIMMLCLILTCILTCLSRKLAAPEHNISVLCEYKYSGITTLFADAFINCRRDIAILSAALLFSTSIACKVYAVSLSAYKGIFCGILIADLVSICNIGATYKQSLSFILPILHALIVLKYLSVCISYNKRLHVYYQRRSMANTVKLFIKLLILFTSFAGALCILKITELLIYSI